MIFVQSKNSKKELTASLLANHITDLYKQLYTDIYLYREEIQKLCLSTLSLVQTRLAVNKNVVALTSWKEVEEDLLKVLPEERQTLKSLLRTRQAEEEKTKSIEFWNIKIPLDHSYEKVWINRDDWIDFLEEIVNDYSFHTGLPCDFFVYSKHLKTLKPQIKTAEEWFDFFYEEAFALTDKKPLLIGVVQALLFHKKLANLSDESWLIGSSFLNLIEENGKITYQKIEEKLELKKTDRNVFFQNISLKHFQSLGFSIEELEEIIPNLDIDKEMNISWLAENLYKRNKCLPAYNQYLEPFQWLFLRAALFLKGDVVKNYQALSNLEIILPDFFYKELIKPSNEKKVFNQQYSVLVPDEYEQIQKAIFSGIVSTQWAGSVHLDFSNIREKGRLVRRGNRVSNGLKPYLASLNNLIIAQGRNDHEKPITVSIPIYHIELLEILPVLEQETKVQINIIVPDYFFKALSQNEDWKFIAANNHILSESEYLETKPLKKYKAMKVLNTLVKYPVSFSFINNYKETGLLGREGQGILPDKDKAFFFSVSADARNLEKNIDILRRFKQLNCFINLFNFDKLTLQNLPELDLNLCLTNNLEQAFVHNQLEMYLGARQIKLSIMDEGKLRTVPTMSFYREIFEHIENYNYIQEKAYQNLSMVVEELSRFTPKPSDIYRQLENFRAILPLFNGGTLVQIPLYWKSEDLYRVIVSCHSTGITNVKIVNFK